MQGNLAAVASIFSEIPTFVSAEDVRGRTKNMLNSMYLRIVTLDQRQTPINSRAHMSQTQRCTDCYCQES